MAINKVFHTAKEFREIYYPDDSKQYPIEMFVSEKERQLILDRRGKWLIKPNSEVKDE